MVGNLTKKKGSQMPGGQPEGGGGIGTLGFDSYIRKVRINFISTLLIIRDGPVILVGGGGGGGEE